MDWKIISSFIEPIAPNTAKHIITDKDLQLKFCKFLNISEDNCSPESIQQLLDDETFVTKLLNFETINFPPYMNNKIVTPTTLPQSDESGCEGICISYVYLKLQIILSMIATIAFFAIVGYVIAFGLADLSKEGAFIVGNLTGIAGAIAKDVYGYFFGSSLGSKEKSDQLSKQQKI